MAGPADLFAETITYALVTGRDAFGKPTLSGQTPARARVQPSRKTIRDATGAEHVTSHVVYTDAPVTLMHRFWLPGDKLTDPPRRPAAIDEHKAGRATTAMYRKVWF